MSYYEMMELGAELDQQFEELVRNCLISGEIDQGLYQKYDVKRGLRDANGKGVLTGLTEISDVLATRQDENGVSHPIDGELYFQGINVVDLVGGNAKNGLCLKRRPIYCSLASCRRSRSWRALFGF